MAISLPMQEFDYTITKQLKAKLFVSIFAVVNSLQSENDAQSQTKQLSSIINNKYKGMSEMYGPWQPLSIHGNIFIFSWREAHSSTGRLVTGSGARLGAENKIDRPQTFPNKKSTKVNKYKSTHNSAIFWATDSRLCMEIRIDSPNKIQKYKK